MQTSFFPTTEDHKKPYKVLARKYRPTDFEHMIGQEALVQTFRNAIKSGRIAHAFLLTGIRGVGKTTTARIIAKALNCIGENGTLDSPSEKPCGKCINCISISEDRHQDVLELDAASHTGVADMREIIENVKYKPTSARYKVYIIDEAHMLSNSAFNALLKTLEEPPAHTKFILATTEVKKIPATILSRCQRFDLKRVEPDVLKDHFIKICQAEGCNIDEAAAALIGNIAAGSVRDGLSILDQAISLSQDEVKYSIVQSMLGLADIEATLDILTNISIGNPEKVLRIAKDLYNKGVDPSLLLQDMLESVHAITKIKILKLNASDLYSQSEAEKYNELAQKLTISFLNRAWQIITKGLDEVKYSYHPFPACEMVLIRLIYTSSLPSVEELIRSNGEVPKGNVTVSNNKIHQEVQDVTVELNYSSEVSIDWLLKLCLDNDEMMLHHHIISDLVIVSINDCRIEISLRDWAPKTLQRQLQEFINKATGKTWSIVNVDSKGLTISEQQIAKDKEIQDNIALNPKIKEVLNTFTDLEIADIKPMKTTT